MKFLKLHYREGGREFLINTYAIAGIEINGKPESGCVITLVSVDQKGEPRHEVVSETLEEIERMLSRLNLLTS
jgi:hypothetical protein